MVSLPVAWPSITHPSSLGRDALTLHWSPENSVPSLSQLTLTVLNTWEKDSYMRIYACAQQDPSQLTEWANVGLVGSQQRSLLDGQPSLSTYMHRWGISPHLEWATQVKKGKTPLLLLSLLISNVHLSLCEHPKASRPRDQHRKLFLPICPSTTAILQISTLLFVPLVTQIWEYIWRHSRVLNQHSRYLPGSAQ